MSRSVGRYSPRTTSASDRIETDSTATRHGGEPDVVGATLVEIREHIETLASADGQYYVRCGRTGDRPVPALGKRFDDRAIAREAARAVEQYRSTLRQYDPRVPYYDVVVCEDTGPIVSPREACDCLNASSWDLSAPVLEGSDRKRAASELVEFCHQVAAATFETLSEMDYDDVETAIMDAYFAHAESIERADELCLCLLESTASELENHLTSEEQATVLEAAAERIDDPTDDGRSETPADPVQVTFTELRDRGLVGDFRCQSLARDAESRTVAVSCSSYALREQGGRLPVLPIVVDLFRHDTAWPPATVSVSETDADWRVTLELSATGTPDSLVTAPVTES